MGPTRAFNFGAAGTGDRGLAGLEPLGRGADESLAGLGSLGNGDFPEAVIDAADPAATGWRTGKPTSMARLHFGHSTCLPAELSGTCIACEQCGQRITCAINSVLEDEPRPASPVAKACLGAKAPAIDPALMPP
ncbi:MAG: hypothetical protein ACJ8FY_08250 [Gemmataceae bacterium]